MRSYLVYNTVAWLCNCCLWHHNGIYVLHASSDCIYRNSAIFVSEE